MEKLIFNQEKLQKIDNEVDEIMSRLTSDQEMKELLKKYPDQNIVVDPNKPPKLERVLDFQRVYEQNYPPEKEKYDQLFIMLLDEIDELNRAYNQEDKAEIKKEVEPSLKIISASPNKSAATIAQHYAQETRVASQNTLRIPRRTRNPGPINGVSQ